MSVWLCNIFYFQTSQWGMIVGHGGLDRAVRVVSPLLVTGPSLRVIKLQVGIGQFSGSGLRLQERNGKFLHKWKTTAVAQSSDVGISPSGPAGRLLGSGKQLNTQAEAIHCTELYWSVTAAEGGKRPKAQSYPPPCHLFSTVREGLHLAAEQIQSGGRGGGLLGADAFTVTWEERVLQKKKRQRTENTGDNRWSLEVYTVSALELSQVFLRGEKVTFYQVTLPQVQSKVPVRLANCK